MYRLSCFGVLVLIARPLWAANPKAIEQGLIKCDVCQLAIGTAYELARNKDEDAIFEVLDEVCDPDKEVGTALWASVDIQQTKKVAAGVRVVDMRPEVQLCGAECRRAAKVCEGLFVEHGDAIVEAIEDDMELDDLRKKTCETWSKACVENVLPADFSFPSEDIPFLPTDDDDKDKVRRLKKLKEMQMKQDMGLGAQIHRLEGELRESYDSKLAAELVETQKVDEQKAEL